MPTIESDLKEFAMKAKHYAPLVGRLLAGGTAIAAASYATYAVTTWYRYGRIKHKVALEDSCTP